MPIQLLDSQSLPPSTFEKESKNRRLALEERIRKRKQKIADSEENHRTLLEIAQNALETSQRETDDINSLKIEQEKIKKRMVSVLSDLIVAGQNMALLNQKQSAISDEKTRVGETFDSIEKRLNILFLEISQVREKDEKIDQQYRSLHDRCTIIEEKQQLLEINSHHLLSQNRSPDFRSIKSKVNLDDFEKKQVSNTTGYSLFSILLKILFIATKGIHFIKEMAVDIKLRLWKQIIR